MRKVFRNGNSLAVTVPKAYAHQLNIRDGSKIEWEETKKGILLVPQNQKTTSKVDSKFAQLVDEFMNEHADVLAELSKR